LNAAKNLNLLMSRSNLGTPVTDQSLLVSPAQIGPVLNVTRWIREEPLVFSNAPAQ
jgi:hypothetical protein